MYEVSKIKSSMPILKILQKTLWFWKTPKFSKISKLRLKNMKFMNMRDLDTYQVKRNFIKVENLLEMKFREIKMCLGGETVENNRKRSRKVRSESCYPYLYKLSNSR